MTLPKDYVMKLVAGDAYRLIVDYVDTNDVPINITGETVTLKVYLDKVLSITLTSGSGLTISPTIGRIQIDFTNTQTDTLDGKKDRRHVLRLDTSNKTLMVGKIEVYQNV